ncbi:potassium/sodium hyperpolarization-activated cyclic nucleotide-gated channel 4-like [Spodoptera litura]|uniref:Potassium/sodium hyperpolarization-activated cyclic nucleotide-gated channel 4-like n=1 Tax=Spodoptera litura TaxID=69820 RepID=A0A9J7EML1_SPOLT|nr:potassium/sodium hyperpolarization-activated cyclic nucleotide-gated channel 4-like [Spodoptera litura]
MNEHGDYYNSYFHHTCVVIPEKDVLETDIIGTGCVARFQRWWQDLFLLSYTSGKCRGFYASSHAIRVERFRQFRKYRSRIHPMSKFKNFWDFLMLQVFIVNKLLFRFLSSFIFDSMSIYSYYLGAFLELIIIMDLYVSLKTGYINHEAKRVVLDSHDSLLHFCTYKMFLHVASATPLHWFMFLKYGTNIKCGLCKANKFICVLKIISVFSLYRVYETSTFWTEKLHTASKIQYKYLFKFLRIGVIGMMTMCQYYDISDVAILLVAFHTGSVEETSLLGIRTNFKYGNVTMQLSTNYFYVCYEINRIFKSLQLFSYGIREKVYYLDKITALLGYALATFFYFWSFKECFSLINTLIHPKDLHMKLRCRALTMLSTRQISNELSSRLQKYFKYGPTKPHIIEKTNKLYMNMPNVLKNEIKLHSYMKYMMRIPYFCQVPLPLLEEIVLLLRKEIYMSNAIITQALVPAEGLMIVENGELAVYSNDEKEEGHLIDGDYFAGLSLVTVNERCLSFVVSIRACSILLLEKKRFRELMKKHVKYFWQIKTQIVEHYKIIQENLNKTDRYQRSALGQQPLVEYELPYSG